MNNTNNYPNSKLCVGLHINFLSIQATTTVDELKEKKINSQYHSIFNNHRFWSKTLISAILCDNEEVVMHVVKTCGKEIFAKHLSTPYYDVPLSYVQTAKMAQLLINLGADVNINYDNTVFTHIGNNNKHNSPLLTLLSIEEDKRDEDSLIKISKCFIRNGAVISEEDMNTPKKQKIIPLALEGIKTEDKEFRDRGVTFLNALQDEESIVFKSGIDHDTISFICQEIIETHFFSFIILEKKMEIGDNSCNYVDITEKGFL